MPTFDDMNELTTSGTLPERSAAKILSSLIPPTTFTFTSGCFWSYSATTFLNSLSSRWLQPTQIVIVVAFAEDVPASAEVFATAPAPAARVCLHGDVHLKNGLLQARRIALIDLDQMGTGPAAADLGSAMAGIRYHALVTDEIARGARLQRALLDGYASLRELPDAHALRWHVAAALLSERALRAVNRIRPDGLAHLGAVLADARAALRGEAV
jgi:Ser/Thr protein kinase RdoA (MazF antagonist)